MRAVLTACLLAGRVAGADPSSLSASIERSVETYVDRDAATVGAPPTCVCANGCRGIMATIEPREPFVGSWPARGIGLALGAAAGLGLGNAAEAEGPPTTLRGWRTADAVVLGGALALNLTTRILDEAPPDLARGRWSDCKGTDDSLNGVDSGVRAALVAESLRSRAHAARISDMTLAASITYPFALTLGANPDDRHRDLLVVAETLVVSGLVNDVAKRVFDRPRPFVHYCAPQRPGDLCTEDAHYSFYSGHASMSFAAAVAAGTISHQHGYRNEGWIWATGLTLATTTGALRIVADKHYFMDVLVGAAAGGLAGWLIPRMHRPEDAPPQAIRPPKAAPAVLSLPLRGSGRRAGIVRAGFGDGPFAEVTWRW